MRDDSDFDINAIQIGESIEVGTLARKRRPRPTGQFVQVPLEWMHRLASARRKASYTVALHLLFRVFKERRQTIKLANGVLEIYGVSRGQKWRALKELEALGLIEIE